MNYREKIQSMVDQINKLYSDAEWLRDFATGEEKEHWNAHRKIFYDAALPLKRLDNSLSKDRAQTCICDNVRTDVVKVLCTNCKTWTDYKKHTCKDCNDTWTHNRYCHECGEVVE